MSDTAENDATPQWQHNNEEGVAQEQHELSAENDALPNELVACGAVFAALMPSESVEVVRIIEDGDAAAMVVRFPFLKSPYRITVTMEPDDA